MTICVSDDGSRGGRLGNGNQRTVDQASRHGIDGMRERAALHGGTLVAGPAEGGGWTVTVTLRPEMPRVGS